MNTGSESSFVVLTSNKSNECIICDTADVSETFPVFARLIHGRDARNPGEAGKFGVALVSCSSEMFPVRGEGGMSAFVSVLL